MATEGGPCREAQIPEEIGILAGAADRLSNIVDQLENRLTGLVRSEPPIGSEPTIAKTAIEPPILVPIADSINTSHKRIDHLNNRLNHLLNTLEV